MPYNTDFYDILFARNGGGGADVSGVTATAADVDTGKVFVDSSGAEVPGTSTYKAQYTALNTLVIAIEMHYLIMRGCCHRNSRRI